MRPSLVPMSMWTCLASLLVWWGAVPAAQAAEGRVSFAVPAEIDVDFVRVHVGLAPGRYQVSLDLMNAELGPGGRASALDARLARVLSAPQRYYVALTVIDTAGRESEFSNELELDLRTRDCVVEGTCVCPAGLCAPGPRGSDSGMRPAGGGASTPADPVVNPPGPPSGGSPSGGDASEADPTAADENRGGSGPEQVANSGPRVALLVNGEIVVGGAAIVQARSLVQLAALASDPDGLGFPIFAAFGSQEPVRFFWDLSGGLADDPEAHLTATPSVRFPLPAGQSEGLAAVRLTVFDTKGASTEAVLMLRVVANAPPSLRTFVNGEPIEASQSVRVRAGQTVDFSAQASDPDGLGFPVLRDMGIDAPIAYAWDFGGGISDNPLSSLVPNPVVTFALPDGVAAARFTVTLAVYDTTGARTTRTIPVEVRR